MLFTLSFYCVFKWVLPPVVNVYLNRHSLEIVLQGLRLNFPSDNLSGYRENGANDNK